MNDDAELIRRYVSGRDEAAFAELVRRHIDFVHSAALRQVNGDAHAAADVTQLVFVDFARKADRLGGERVLKGWLFTSTRYAAAKRVRSEQRRRAREAEAHVMNEQEVEPNAGVDWARVRPVLDDALAELKDGERVAILLRYFEGREFSEVAVKLNLNANAARMRVERGLDKLHGLLARRGVTSTTAALATALSGQAVTAAPAGLMASVTGVALASGGAVGVVGTFMTMTKVQLGLAAALVTGGATAYLVQANTTAELQARVAALRQEGRATAELERENLRLAKLAAESRELAQDDVELTRLEEETGKLREQLKVLAARDDEQRRRAEMAKASERAAFSVAVMDRAPEFDTTVRPVYPTQLRRAGISGDVQVEFVVDTEGRVREPKVVEATHREFEAPALEAIQGWRFRPGLKGGRPVNTRLVMPVVFKLDDATAAAAASAPLPAGN